MKKDSYNEKRETNRFSAVSKDNGIVFYSDFVEVETTTLKNQMIKTEVRPRNPMEMFFGMMRKSISDNITVEGMGKIRTNIITLTLILLAILINNWYMVIAMIFFRVTSLENLLDFIMISIQIKLGNNKSLGRYHAAEHMSLKAYEKLGRAPTTIEEVRQCSRYDEYCGSMILLRPIMAVLPQLIVLSICPYLNSMGYIICFLLSFIISSYLMCTKKIKYLQIFITNKPTDLEIKNAIAGLTKLEETLKKISKDENVMPRFRISFVIM